MNEVYVRNEIATHPKQIIPPCRVDFSNKNNQGVFSTVDEEWLKLLIAFKTPLEILDADLREIIFVDGPKNSTRPFLESKWFSVGQSKETDIG